MPMEFHFDPEKRALFGTITAPLTLEEFQASIEVVVGSKEFPPDIRTLWDMREFEFKDIDSGLEEGLISISEKFPERRSAKVALIVQNDLGLGKATMFEIMADKLGYKTMVFRSYSEGENWLIQELI